MYKRQILNSHTETNVLHAHLTQLFQRTITTLVAVLQAADLVGFGMTVQDKNAPALVPLYKISNEMGMEFATASLHNLSLIHI